ncbi:MAG: hypothetical protein C0459_01275 [Chitinophaga sp.]|jgi:hypothetical protein|nr:hypothetical protein [Chitinophaga sp.]
MANVKLSDAEMKLVTDASFILTKNNIINKVYALFGELSMALEHIAKEQNLPQEILSAGPKISRGENYEGLPWVMLDYPRCFKHEDFFAMRIFFWWGNFFSITLQLKGKYKFEFRNAVADILKDDWFVCINKDEWQHHFREDNYKPLHALTIEEINALPFFKLAKKIPLGQWDNALLYLQENYHQLLSASQSVE